MTQIESKIYAALASDDGGEIHLAQIACLYTQAHGANFNVYKRIQWDLLDAHIKEKRGDEGLDYCQREAVRAQ